MPQSSKPVLIPESCSKDLRVYCGKLHINTLSAFMSVFSTQVFNYTGQEQVSLSLQSTDSGKEFLKEFNVNFSDDLIFRDLVSSIQSRLGEFDSVGGWKISTDQDCCLTLSISTDNVEGALILGEGNKLKIESERISGHFITLLTETLANPDQPLNRYQLLTEDEYDQIVVQWNKTGTEFPPENLCIHEIIEKQAARTPGNIAIRDGDRSITYADLIIHANQLAGRLQSAGVEPGGNIGITLEPSIEIVIAMLAIFKTGCAFVALDGMLPKNRVSLILEEARVRFLISGTLSEDDQLFDSVKIIQIDTFVKNQAVSSDIQNSLTAMDTRPEDICFILFTSGSTGKPKGVLHTHGNIINRFHSLSHIAPMGESDVFTQSSPISSIDAIDEIIYPLLWGASTAIIPAQIVKDPRRLVKMLEKAQATHILLVPSLLRVILEISGELKTRLARLKVWIIGGEPLDAGLARDFHERLPGAKLINYYGLTEGDATCFDTSRPHPFSQEPPIGRATPNVQVYLLNSAHAPVPVGVPGEICIGGKGIASGYLNLPELTSQRFIEDVFIPGPGRKLFLTGDLGRYAPDGTIEFLGRKDHQVKIRGFRVELNEVEEELKRHPAIKEAVVTLWQPPVQQAGFDRLVGYVVKNPNQPFSAQDVRIFLASRLPEYAVPAYIIPVDAFPLNPNGKIDRKALPAPQIEQLNRSLLVTPARDDLEKGLIEMWEEVLGISPIGIHDGFFELGGDSLSVICFLVMVEKQYNRDLPIDIFFQVNTVAEFAEIIRGNKTRETWSSLVPIQPRGTKSPLYCVHADGGVLIYRSVAKLLGPDYPVYGLQAQGLDGRKEPLGSVEEIAAYYIREIRTVQPRGPYHLGAFSLGGAFIFEMAKQLRAAGEPVGLLAFFDAGSPSYPQFPEKKAFIKHKFSVHIVALGLKDNKEKISYLWRRTRSRVQVTLLPIIGAVLQKLKMNLPHNVRYVVVRKTLLDAVDRYTPGVYPGDIVLFSAKLQPEGCIPDPTLGWGKHVSGNIQIEEIEGDHNAMMKEKFLRQVTSRLKTMIN